MVLVLSHVIQESLSKKTNEHAEVMKEVTSLKEVLEQKAVSYEKSWASERYDSVFVPTYLLVAER